MTAELDRLLREAGELLKLSPDQIVKIYREKELQKALTIARNAAVADAKALTSGKWWNAQQKYENSLIKRSAGPLKPNS